jgi:hypothetical protein
VAGAVIGPLAAIVAVGLLGYWIGHRRLKAAADSNYNLVAQTPASGYQSERTNQLTQPSGNWKFELPS